MIQQAIENKYSCIFIGGVLRTQWYNPRSKFPASHAAVWPHGDAVVDLPFWVV
jgi:hypothetical protein